MINNCPCSEFDFSFIKTGYFTNKINTCNGGEDTFLNIHPNVTYIKYGSGWFNAIVETKSYRAIICTSVQMNAKHYIDLAEDLPDINSLDINDYNKTLKIGDNFNDFEKFPQSVRDKIFAKGWLITQ